jgi:mannose-6-phosphate isomerase-like protein (cupin superfamily)
MQDVSGKGFLIRHLENAEAVPCPCGISVRPLPVADSKACSVHVTTIHDSVIHYHAKTTEVYYILSGEGMMELNGETFQIQPGCTIYIEPGTRHRLMSSNGVQTLVMGIPPFDASDEFFD